MKNSFHVQLKCLYFCSNILYSITYHLYIFTRYLLYQSIHMCCRLFSIFKLFIVFKWLCNCVIVLHSVLCVLHLGMGCKFLVKIDICLSLLCLHLNFSPKASFFGPIKAISLKISNPVLKGNSAICSQRVRMRWNK